VTNDLSDETGKEIIFALIASALWESKLLINKVTSSWKLIGGYKVVR